jgi:hypothetical protein
MGLENPSTEVWLRIARPGGAWDPLRCGGVGACMGGLCCSQRCSWVVPVRTPFSWGAFEKLDSNLLSDTLFVLACT